MNRRGASIGPASETLAQHMIGIGLTRPFASVMRFSDAALFARTQVGV